MDAQSVKKLYELHTKMFDILTEIENIIKADGTNSELNQAKAYWMGHIDAALGGGDFVDDMFTLKKLIIDNGIDWDTGEIEEEEEEEEEEKEITPNE